MMKLIPNISIKNFLAVVGVLVLIVSLSGTAALAVDQEDFGKFNLESYWYSRYILSRAHARSGFGVHMLRGPLFGGDMKKLRSTVKSFSEKTGHALPPNPWPVFLEFKSGDPYFAQNPKQSDFSTLRWQKDSFDKTIVTGALGQAAVKKIVWIEQFLRAIYDPPENRFIGFVLTGEVLNTLNWLRTNGTNTGEPLDPKDPQGAYFPHAFKLGFEMEKTEDGKPLPPKPTSVMVENSDSLLSDQWALLWATTELKTLAESDETSRYYDGDPFPAEVKKLATGLSTAIFSNIQNRHWNEEVGTLVDRNKDGVEMGNELNTATVSRAVIGLANLYKAFHGSRPSEKAEKMVADQAEYLLGLQNEDGRFPDGANLKTGDVEMTPTSLESQMAAINALLITYDITGNEEYKTGAFRGFQWALDNLWDEENGVYKSSADANSYRYDPWTLGSVLAASRNLLLKGDDLAGHRLVEFWQNAVNGSGMIQAELPQTAEVIGDGKDDTDGDGIPEPGKASATEEASYGVDSVLANEVRLDSMTGEWTVTDRTYYTQSQMYAANEMYITGIPTFAPQMIDALALRSITPESKVELPPMDEAKASHDRMMKEQGMASEEVTITVEGGEWFFKPETIMVKQGQEVTIKLENVGSVPHNLKVGQFDAKTETVGGGSTTSITFVADKAGKFPFWCAIPGHRSAGMEGTLIVE